MAESTVTQTGVADLRAAVDALPQAITDGLKAVAIDIGNKIQADARSFLLDHTKAEKTAAAIAVTVNEANKSVYVTSRGVSVDPANNPIWLEHGTIHQPATPYMLPATQAHEDEYTQAQAAAAFSIAQGQLR